MKLQIREERFGIVDLGCEMRDCRFVIYDLNL